MEFADYENFSTDGAVPGREQDRVGCMSWGSMGVKLFVDSWLWKSAEPVEVQEHPFYNLSFFVVYNVFTNGVNYSWDNTEANIIGTAIIGCSVCVPQNTDG